MEFSGFEDMVASGGGMLGAANLAGGWPETHWKQWWQLGGEGGWLERERRERRERRETLNSLGAKHLLQR